MSAHDGMEHTIKVNGHTIRYGMRDLIQVAVLGLSVVGTFFLFNSRVSRNTDAIDRGFTIQHMLEARVQKIDENGTRRSHETDAMQQQMIEYHTQQLNDINKRLADIIPKVDKIDANVLWLMGRQLEARK